MSHSERIIAFLLAAEILLAPPAFAGDAPSEVYFRTGPGDPVAGKDKSALCQGCHGENGNSVAPNFPKLAGQYAVYIQRQLKNFAERSRKDSTMFNMALTVANNQDNDDIAAYFASQSLMTGTKSKIKADKILIDEGKKIYSDSQKFRCINCHGEHGKGTPHNNPMFPIIGGQQKNYLFKQLIDFRTDARNTDMSETMNELTKQMSFSEIRAVSLYLSAQ